MTFNFFGCLISLFILLPIVLIINKLPLDKNIIIPSKIKMVFYISSAILIVSYSILLKGNVFFVDNIIMIRTYFGILIVLLLLYYTAIMKYFVGERHAKDLIMKLLFTIPLRTIPIILLIVTALFSNYNNIILKVISIVYIFIYYSLWQNILLNIK